MAQQPIESKMAREVEHTVGKMSNLKVLPAAAVAFLKGLFIDQLAPSELTKIIEREPALVLMLYTLAAKRGKTSTKNNFSISQAFSLLDLRAVRDNFFSIELYQPIDGNGRTELRKKLIINSVAVASIAREIVNESPLDCNSDLAYAAGLLYNIGNLALDETMPRSFLAMVSHAEAEHKNICDVQQKNLNTDYTILGKRLAVKARLPQSIQLAVWLHRSAIEDVIETMPEAKIALIVRAAYQLAGNLQIGTCGSFDNFQLDQSIVNLIGLELTELEDIAMTVSQQLQTEQLYIQDTQQSINDYCKMIQFVSAQLASEGTTYFQQAQRAQTKSSHYDFTVELLNGIADEAQPIEIAEQFACQWQKFYQTGKVCLYLTQQDDIEAVILGGDNRQIKYLNPPTDNPPIPEWIHKEFRVIDTDIDFNWLFDQLDVEFEKEKTKVAPLIFKDHAIGAIVFEFHYPVGKASLQEMFSSTCHIAASIVEAAFARSRQQRFAESFARSKSAPLQPAFPEEKTQTKIKADTNIDVLAEMAAGAAHELNNPLSVISGRAQLLGQTEDDDQKKQYLSQIQQNCSQLSGIVEDLMAYAQPAPPRKAFVSVNQIVDEAMQLTSLKTGKEDIDFNVDVSENSNDVFVDSGQIVSSLANIISNAVESYSNQQGTINITANRIDGSVTITITDKGRGMDEETSRKVFYPFFSSKQAGRKRGMGLAYAKRLIELNNGTISIESQPDQGTTVTITLPSS